jgi:hypothetical protein
MTQTPAIKVFKAPPEVGGFRYVMIWHPRVNTDAAHSWLRATMRHVGDIISKNLSRNQVDLDLLRSGWTKAK